MEILDLQPKKVFKYFSEISKIPRCSGNEKEISDYLVNFGKERGFDVYQDEALNVYMKKKASPGYENAPTVILQGHMDMVCVKSEDSNHNFCKDPIKLIYEDGIIHADKTTLGADNGIAVAMALAYFDSDEYKHPNLEMLITSSEETGMDGAIAVDGKLLEGKYLLNIDSEEDYGFTVSCAGGVNQIVRFKEEFEDNNSCEAYTITVDGLLGGHSGMEIIKERANAIKVVARFLNSIKDKIVLAEIGGGTKHNAIPNKAFATFTASEDISSEFEKFRKEITNEYKTKDKGLRISLNRTEIKKTYTKDLSDRLVSFLALAPHGIKAMSADIKGLVETSDNLSVVEKDDGNIKITFSIRSSIESARRELEKENETLAKILKADVQSRDGYPAWEFEEDSKLLSISKKVYKDVFNKEPEILAIHAGLECGLLKKHLPNTEMISFGPNLHDVHSEKERMEVESVNKMFNFLVELLENIK